MKRLIEADLYDIVARVKEIDENYFIMYDYRLKRFEVHHSRQKGNTLCLLVPYNELDARTVLMVRRTRVERREKLLKELSVSM